ncbi:MAG: M15 family metallopeptidase [Rhodoferax sp.]|nr:M15 family metallopeptidase [Rhodoferax sp.]
MQTYPACGLRCEEVPGHPDFVGLGDIAGIEVDLRYASSANFFGKNLYAFLDCAWLHKDAAHALARAAEALQAARPDYRLLVLDAMRPQRVQQMLWDVLQATHLRQYLADPANGSIHSFGMAVDVTLQDSEGQEVDMGSGFDEMSERSHPEFEAQLLSQGQLTRQHVAHRQLLRGAMLHAGFMGIPHEWWHFDYGDSAKVRAQCQRIL